MHSHIPGDSDPLRQALHYVSSRALDDLGDHVQLGVKRFAKALARVKPDIRHSQAIEVIAKSMSFKDWHDLTASLSSIDRTSKSLLERVLPMLDCPYPPYDKPCSEAARALESIAAKVAAMLDVDTQEVLDNVVAFVHEASSYSELLARDPCVAGPVYEDVDFGSLQMTPQGRAAEHALTHELDDIRVRPDVVYKRLLSIVKANPQFFFAWTQLLNHATLHFGHQTPTSEIAAAGLEALTDLADAAPYLDDEDEDLFHIFEATRLVMRELVWSGKSESAHGVGRAILSCANVDDVAGISYFLCVALTDPALADLAEEEVEDQQLLDVFAEGIGRNDPDSLLCVGMLMLALRAPSNFSMSYLARANLVTNGGLRKALGGDQFALYESDAEFLVDDVDFSSDLIAAFVRANRGLCESVSKVLNCAAMRKAEREVSELYYQAAQEDDGTLDGVDTDLCWRSEVVSRARAMSAKLRESWERSNAPEID